MKNTLIALSLLFISCTVTAQQRTKNKEANSQQLIANSYFKAGDILFQDLDCGSLCDAIEKVTYGYQDKDYSHVGLIVEDKNKNLFVIEAIGGNVQKTPLDDFFKRSPKILGARLIPEYQPLIKKACKYAEQFVNTPYDDRFIMNNDSLYCSELIYEAFKKANHHEEIFYLLPMTFKDPETRDFFPAWTEYYKNLHSRIPENEPGINPGVISRSDKLIIIYNNHKFIF
jgi:hypothetical protein